MLVNVSACCMDQRRSFNRHGAQLARNWNGRRGTPDNIQNSANGTATNAWDVGKVSPLSGYGKSVRYLASTSVCTGRPPRSSGSAALRADGQLERVQAAAMEGSTEDPDQRPSVQFYVLRL